LLPKYQQSRFDLSGQTLKGLPFLKWPGGKRALLKHLLPLLPKDFDRYYEPFLGGGALFFALQPTKAILSDNNVELINCYIMVRDFPEETISHLATLKNSKEDYYRIRDEVPKNDVARAARFIYLSALSFNAIHRVNLEGKFNVPYNNKSHLQPGDPGKIREASVTLQSAELQHADFSGPLSAAKAGDVVYLDPPYTVAHGNNGFVKYNAKVFSWSDQVRLAETARILAENGCSVFVSNADHPSIVTLYSGFRLERITRNSIIAAARTSRREVTECIFYNEVSSSC